MKYFIKTILVLFLLFSVNSGTFANVKLPQVISDHMMFQRNKEIKVWGWADSRERVSVTFNSQVKKTRAGKDGKWMVIFPAMEAGGPLEMTIKGKNLIKLEDILIGDIWICSGQSNMEFSVERGDFSEREIAEADYPNIRLLQIAKNQQLTLVDDVPETEWKVCNSESIPTFSAVGYFFGRYIHKEEGVPVGLIGTNWGGTVVEAWTSEDYLKGLDNFDERLENLRTYDPNAMTDTEDEILKELKETFNIPAGSENLAEDWSAVEVDYTYWKEAELPGYWEKKDLRGVNGVVWYRKEVELTKEMITKGVLLNLGRIDDSDVTWVNGTKVGETYDKYDADRSYYVEPGVLVEGTNVIAVRVEDPFGNGGFYSSPSMLNISYGNRTISLAGTWKYKLTGEGLSFRITPTGPNELPSSLFKGMINPLLNLAVKGAIWYQGESNASRAYQYRHLMPLMIKCWRDKWNQPDMPFFMVQLANYQRAVEVPGHSSWAELREAQLFTTIADEKTGMAVAIDIGMADDIHPTNKQDVGLRLGLSARKIAYGRDIVYSGPVFEKMEIKDSEAVISFTSIGSGLKICDKYGYLKGFTIAGKDQKFYWAKARVEGDKVVVFSPEVKEPVAVRYGWADNPDDVNLYNEEGLPASPFRTDDWKGITYGVY